MSEKFNPQEYRDDLAQSLKDKRELGEKGRELAREQLSFEKDTVEYGRAKIDHKEDLLHVEDDKKIFEEIMSGNIERACMLTTIVPEVAKVLVEKTSLPDHYDELDLSRLVKLSEDVAKILSNHNGNLLLNSITEIDYHALSFLCKHKGSYISLNHLRSIDIMDVDCLLEYRGKVNLEGAVISDTTAQYLAQKTRTLTYRKFEFGYQTEAQINNFR